MTGLRCVNGHSFDRAREGYVNLLPAGRLKGGSSGDDDAMVRARRTVFDAGLYAPIIDRVAAVTAGFDPACVLDAGCGEGSYLGAATAASSAEGWGVDISKSAIRLAARRHPAHRYAVASSYLLPFADGSVDAIINVFSPRPFAEMARVLTPTGTAVVVTPGPRHLSELKSTVYQAPRRHDDAPERADDIVATETVTFEVALPDSTLRLALLHMTPFWWSAPAERRDEVAATLVSVTADMRLTVYRFHS